MIRITMKHNGHNDNYIKIIRVGSKNIVQSPVGIIINSPCILEMVGWINKVVDGEVWRLYTDVTTTSVGSENIVQLLVNIINGPWILRTVGWVNKVVNGRVWRLYINMTIMRVGSENIIQSPVSIC